MTYTYSILCLHMAFLSICNHCYSFKIIIHLYWLKSPLQILLDQQMWPNLYAVNLRPTALLSWSLRRLRSMPNVNLFDWKKEFTDDTDRRVAVTQLAWQNRAGRHSQKISQVMPRKNGKNTQHYHLTNDYCYMKKKHPFISWNCQGTGKDGSFTERYM